MRIVTVQEMRAVEQASVEHGVSLEELQRNAAAAVAGEIERLFGETRGVALFLVGPGNNGRDSLLAADLLQKKGWSVSCYLAPKVGSEDVLGRLEEGRAAIHSHSGTESYRVLRAWIRQATVVVDGLLGIGIRGPAREPMAGIIAEANREAAAARASVVAVDLPSGIDADTGEVPGEAIRADFTVSLGCVKTGLLKLPAAELVGTLIPVGIGLPAESYASVRTELLDAAGVASLLPARPLDAHKGTFGRVLVVAGSRSFVGAGYLAGAAAARVGCGLVTLAVPEWQRVALASLLPEATYLPLLDTVDDVSADANARAIAETLPDCSALALGPGLGQGDGQIRLVMGVLEAAAMAGIPTVVDADGLNALAAVDGWWERVGSNLVLTPHPGEMSRLAGLPAAAVNADRWGVAAASAARWGQAVVLKGAFTVVAEPGGALWVSPEALPALASAGTGDVLTGLVAGLMAQRLAPTAAARAGVFLHAAAARAALAQSGVDRLLASDLLPSIPRAIAGLGSASGTAASD